MRMKLLLTTFVASLLISTAVFAQVPPPPEPGYEPAPRGPRHRPGAGGDLYRMCRNAGVYLSDEQLNEMSSIDYEYELKINELEYQKRNIDYKFKIEREKIDIDLNLIKDLINQKKDLEKDIDYLRVEKDVSILGVLTDEQLQQLNTYRMRYYYYR